MSRTFGEILSDYMKLHDELQNKVFDDVIYAERVAVVRCKDCKQRCVYGKDTHFYFCKLHELPVDDADYCSWGEERREK